MKVRELLPRGAKQWRCRWRLGDRIVEVDVIFTTSKRWCSSPLAGHQLWSVITHGPFAIALKATI